MGNNVPRGIHFFGGSYAPGGFYFPRGNNAPTSTPFPNGSHDLGTQSTSTIPNIGESSDPCISSTHASS